MNKNVCLYLYIIYNIECFSLIFQKLRDTQSLKSIISSNFMLMNDMKSLKTIDYYVQIILLKCVEILIGCLFLKLSLNLMANNKQ